MDQVPLPIDESTRGTIEILVVDDEHTLRESCASLLKSEGYQVTVCGRGDDALDQLRRKRFDILLLDLYMSQVSGLDIMKEALERYPDTLVVLMTGNPSIESSVEAMQKGAWDYIPKPFSASHLHVLIGRASHAVVVARESREEAEARKGAKGAEADDGVTLLGTSRAFQQVVELARKVARTDASVFITGESGTGKELIAQFIHRNSRRSSRSLVPVNCAAIPENLMESEMFGHVEGAFTGATRAKEGLLEVANGGTLFLDELTEMPFSIQAKLLRVIQDGVVRRVGSTKTDALVNIRFLAASNRDPSEAVRNGRLREDLHYRLRVVPIHIPPLRERPDDIPVLAEHFLQTFWKHHRGGDGTAPEFGGEARDALVRCPWRGNVRELKNVIEHAVVLLEPGVEITPADLPFMEDNGPSSGGAGIGEYYFNVDYHEARERVLAEFERGYLEHVVQRAKGNISDAARIAGVDRTTLYRLMEKHNTRRDLLLSPDRD